MHACHVHRKEGALEGLSLGSVFPAYKGRVIAAYCSATITVSWIVSDV